MKVWLVPLNTTIGDIQGNAGRMRRVLSEAAALGNTVGGGESRGGAPDLVIFPELAITGYPPKDLLLQEGFLDAAERAAAEVGESCGAGVTVVLGVPLRRGEGIANSLVAYRDGVRLARYDKRLLPTYDVFDEDRYFVAGDEAVVIDVPSAGGAVRVGLSICEDLWRGEDVGFSARYEGREDPVRALVRAGARVIVNPSASPFVLGKGRRHHDLLAMHAVRHGVPVLAVNQLGGNDELVFDGHAVAIGPRGEVIAANAGFDDAPLPVDVPCGELGEGIEGSRDRGIEAGGMGDDPYLAACDEELLYRVLVLGVRDYMRKTGFKTAVLGLSGGIDSAVTAVIAAAAVGAANVHGIALPSRYSSPGSLADAAELARRVGMPHRVIPIEPGYAALLGSLAGPFAGTAADVTEENLQSRLRGTILMALSNKFGHLLLTTGNKSELAVGYCTLYGDMNGGLAVLSDVTKQWVYRLARWMNENVGKGSVGKGSRDRGIEGSRGMGGTGDGGMGDGGVIPESSLTKAPSAELRPNQTDQDSLPPYAVLDEIIERYVEGRQSAGRIVGETGFDGAVVTRIVRLIDRSEFKRQQAAVGLKVTGVAFGSGRRYPIAQGWKG